MRRRGAVFVAVGVLIAVMTGMTWRMASSFVRKPHPGLVAQPPLVASVTQLPLSFELNEGQFDSRVLYAAHTSDGTLFFTNDGLTLALPRFAPRPPRFPDPRERLRKHPALQSVTALRLAFDGANLSPEVTATDQQPGIKNYLIGRDPAQWHTHVPLFGKLVYRDVYPGIDLVFHGGESGLLEYDLNVSPGADPNQVRFRFEGANRVEIDHGDLLIHAHSAELRQLRSRVYASASIPRRVIPVSYRIDSRGWIGLDVSKRDARDGLRIDPVIAYSTYLGGSGDGDAANAMALDPAGSVYVAGNVTSIDFPTTDGGLQPENPAGGPWGAAIGVSTVTKLDPTGSALVYSTYIGGKHVLNEVGDEADQIVVTDAGLAYVAGQTCATDFPVTDGGAQTTFGGGAQDGYVFELGPEGDRLIYSTFLGGPFEDSLNCIDLDADGNAYVGGLSSGSFPTSNALQKTYGGGAYNGIFAKLSPDGTRFLYKSYFGGSGSGPYPESVINIKVDDGGQPLLMGYTVSSDIPGHQMSPRSFHDGGGGDVFLTKLTSDGRSQIFFTYLGGSGLDFGWDLKVDPLGNAWVVGHTGSPDFPVTAGAFRSGPASTPIAGQDGPYDAFITVFDPDGRLVYGTFLGGNGDDRALGVAPDSSGHAHVVGLTSSTDLMTIDALRGEHDESLGFDHAQGNGDAFLADMTVDGGLDFLSYVGGSGPEYPLPFPFTGLTAVDSLGATYFVGRPASDDFPTTAHAFQRKRHGAMDVANIVVVKIMPTPLPSTLTSLSSNSASFMGASVYATGTNMSAQCELDFGNVPSLIISAMTGQQLQVSVEPHACGAVDVTLICPGSPISVLPQGFTFTGCDGGVDEDSSDGEPLPAPTSGCGCGSSGTSSFEGLLLCGTLIALVRRARPGQGQTLRRT